MSEGVITWELSVEYANLKSRYQRLTDAVDDVLDDADAVDSYDGDVVYYVQSHVMDRLRNARKEESK